MVEVQTMTGESFAERGWYQLFPMGVEQRGPFRASMVLRYSADVNDSPTTGIHRRGSFSLSDGIPLLLPRQVHGAGILRAEKEYLLPRRPSCDGIFLGQRKLRVALCFADCFPVLLWGVDPEPWMMGLHSGFKGTLLNICGEGVRLLEETFGRDSVSSCHAWIGPGVCPSCYTRATHDPFAAKVKAFFPESCWTEGIEGVHPDLGKAIYTQLVGAGVSSENITRSCLCSSCDHHFCYSYRRGDVLSRMWLFFEIPDSISIGQKNAVKGKILTENSVVRTKVS